MEGSKRAASKSRRSSSESPGMTYASSGVSACSRALKSRIPRSALAELMAASTGKFSTMKSDSKRGVPRGTSLHRWRWVSGVCSNWRSSNCWVWSCWSQESAVVSSSTKMRTGRVLMKSPMAFSMPETSAERPEVVAPKTMSFSPV